ncbi:MAG: hypothetical protein HYU87_05045 [Chloroflexi bacterium]|nr:hypothetical protein [Chloroflexota bacterium]
MTSPKRILILGGGFGGLHVVRHLERHLRRSEADVTLVDRSNYSLFVQTVSCSCDIRTTMGPCRKFVDRRGELAALDDFLRARRVITLQYRRCPGHDDDDGATQAEADDEGAEVAAAQLQLSTGSVGSRARLCPGS